MKHFSSIAALLLPFVLLLLTSTGCTKEKEPLPHVPTNSEKILGTWTLTSELHDEKINGLFIEVLEPCDMDDTWTFSSDGVRTVRENSLECFPTFSSYTNTWKLQEEETILQVRYGTVFFDEYKIAILNDSVLVLHRPLDSNDIHGIVYSKITLKR